MDEWVSEWVDGGREVDGRIGEWEGEWMDGSALNRLLLLIKSSDSFDQTFMQRTTVQCVLLSSSITHEARLEVQEETIWGGRFNSVWERGNFMNRNFTEKCVWVGNSWNQ